MAVSPASDPGRSPAAGEPVLDRDHLSSYTLGDAGLERELLQLFLQQLDQMVGQLKTAGTASEWKFASHSLKGSAAAIGAAEINRLAYEMEMRGFSGHLADGDAMFLALSTAADRFRAAVSGLLA